MSITLAFLAAGFGSRFGGGIKQIEPVGPNGEVLMDYAAYDALKAGFDRIVFIIRRDIEAEFRDRIGRRMEKRCDVQYVYQQIDDLPDGFAVPDGRRKPWGTGQALLACRNVIHEPFCVLNADDYYGAQAFYDVAAFLKSPMKQDGRLHACMAGYVLDKTLSPSGAVTRGVCNVRDGMLTGICETRGIRIENGLPSVDGRAIDPASIVSMNIWGLPAEFIDYLSEGFSPFLRSLTAENAQTAEFLLPEIIAQMLSSGRGDVRVLPTQDAWFGMTYASDREMARSCVKKLILEQVYPEKMD